MAEIKHVKVENKIATYDTNDGVIVCDNSDYKIEFSFDSAWDAYPDKKARLVVYANGRYEGVSVPIKDNICLVPPVFNTKILKVGAFVENAISTSTAAVIPCEFSALSGKVKNLSGFGGGSSGGGSGENGFSPTIEVLPIECGHKVDITDVNGTKSFNVMDGVDGVDGEDGHTPIKGVDYWTEADKEEIVDEVKGAIDLSGKLDKITEPSDHQRVYSVDETGSQDVLLVDYSNEANEGNIPRRTAHGNIYIPNAPEDDAEAANKAYVDGKFQEVIEMLGEAEQLITMINEGGLV